MENKLTAIIEKDDGWSFAYCPEITGANGQGKTIEEAKKSLAAAIELILDDRREDACADYPKMRSVMRCSFHETSCASPAPAQTWL